MTTVKAIETTMRYAGTLVRCEVNGTPVEINVDHAPSETPCTVRVVIGDGKTPTRVDSAEALAKWEAE